MKSFSPSIRIQCSAMSAGLCFTSKKRISLQWSVQEKGILPYSCRHSLYDHRPILPWLLYVSWSNLTTLSALIPSGHHSCSTFLRSFLFLCSVYYNRWTPDTHHSDVPLVVLSYSCPCYCLFLIIRHIRRIMHEGDSDKRYANENMGEMFQISVTYLK